jgi:hypothetical protein
MAANRCRLCLTNWPATAAYSTCPECLQRTDSMTGAQAIPLDEAQTRAKTATFNREYADREANRDGPSPEELGREEAKRLAAEWRKIEAAISG